ncbi:MAG: serine/threonine-protein kinase [Pyrinomonadaceae bacterium]
MDANEWGRIKELFAELVELPAGDRQAILSSVDLKTRIEVSKLLDNFEAADGFIDRPAAERYAASDITQDSIIGSNIDDYRILKRIGTGGMGTVYLAEHVADGLNHRVAVKLIKRGMDTNSVLKRFVQERQILALLEHPNIARFLDGGSTADGLPYFVMEFVDGEPIKRHCDKNGLSTTQRLDLFRKVCAAVSYAHQNLTVHRDLKPSNILVTRSGEPKLLDFGIAKLLDPDQAGESGEATATLFRVLTPEYASPEQIRGENVSTSTDVYSLGVVLYEMLTGVRPFNTHNSSSNQISDQVLTVDPPKPSSVVFSRTLSTNATNPDAAEPTDGDDSQVLISGQPKLSQQVRSKTYASRSKELRGDLDNIILKALQKEPSRRYQSVAEFSEDIRRHMTGLPVSATADTILYRAAKFVRRHSIGVSTFALVFVMLVTAAAITTRQARIADTERTKAEQRLAQVRKLTNSFLFEFHDSIRNLPGATAARALVIDKALEYLEVLSAENPTDASLRHELGIAYYKIANIQGSGDANLGDTAAAMKSFDRARDMLEPLVNLESQNVAYVESLAKVYLAMTIVAAQRGEVEAFVMANQRALELYGKLIEMEPSRKEFRSTISDAYKHRGDYISSRGDLKGSLSYYEKAVASAQSTLDDDPENDYALGQKLAADEAIAATLGNPNYTNLGDTNGSTMKYREVLEISKGRLSRNPRDTLLRANQAYLTENLGVLLGASGDWAAALKCHESALELQEQLVAEDANNAEARWRLANMLMDQGQSLAKLKRFDEAFRSHHRAIAILEKAVNKDDGNTQLQVFLARSFQRLADALAEDNNPGEARAYYQKAIKMDQAMADENEENMDIRWSLAEHYVKLGQLEQKGPDSANSALENFRRAKAIYDFMFQNGLNIDPISDRIKYLDRELAGK